MNRMKRKLMASMCMLLVSAIMVTSTSFAWFTVSQFASAGNVNAQLMRTENIEIAKARPVVNFAQSGGNVGANEVNHGAVSPQTFDANKVYRLTPMEVSVDDITKGTDSFDAAQYHWGATISYKLGTDQALKLPALVEGSKIYGVTYSADGRTSAKQETTTNDSDGVTTYSYQPFTAIGSSERYVVAYGYGFYLRTNVTGEIEYTYTRNKVAKGASVSMQVFKAADKIAEADRNVGTLWAEGGAAEALLVYEGLEQNETTKQGTRKITSVSDTTEKVAEKFHADANAVYYVNMLVYFNGDELFAEDVNEEIDATLQNLTFTNLDFARGGWNGGLAFVAAEDVPAYTQKTYKVGDKVTHKDGNNVDHVYKCVEAVNEANEWSAVESHFVEVVTSSSVPAAYDENKVYEKGTRMYIGANEDGRIYYQAKEETAKASGAFNTVASNWYAIVPVNDPAGSGYDATKTYKNGDKLTGYAGGTLYCISIVDVEQKSWNPNDWALIPTDAPASYSTSASYAAGAEIKLDDGTFAVATEATSGEWSNGAKWLPAGVTAPVKAPASYAAIKNDGCDAGASINAENGLKLYAREAVVAGTEYAAANWTYIKPTIA